MIPTKWKNRLRKTLRNFLELDKTPAPKSLAEQEQDFVIAQAPGMDDNYLFDFKNWSAGRDSTGTGFWPDINGTAPQLAIGGLDVGAELQALNSDLSATQKRLIPGKIAIKPIEVVNELEEPAELIRMNNIDDKISVLKDKEQLIKQHYAKREVTALIERLENRKLYPANKTFFDAFSNTTEEKIDQLLSKYKLVMKPSDIFIPEFPDEAINIMKAYTEKMEELFKKKPVFYVIAEDVHFQKAYEKRDPILLVQSPFGFYYQILGAWDKEMLILGEL
jgi:hypothetical protein